MKDITGFHQQDILFVYEHKEKIDFTKSEGSVQSISACFDGRCYVSGLRELFCGQI